MRASFRTGLLAGFVAGAAATGLAVLLLRPSPRPPDPPPAPVAPAPAVPDRARELEEANQKLSRRIEDLEKVRPSPSPPGPKKENPSPVLTAPAELVELLEKLSESGLAGFRSPKFGQTLEAVKKGGKPAVDYLSNVLKTSTSATDRFYAAALLEGAGDPEGLPGLVGALKNDTDEMVRRMASHAIAMLGAPEGAGPLREAAGGDSDWGVRVNSAYGLAKLQNEDGLRMLRDAYESPQTPAEYRLAVLGGLADVAAPSTAPLFRKILTDTQDVSYLLASIGALEKMKDTGALPALEQIQNSSSSPLVKQAAAKAIDAIRK